MLLTQLIVLLLLSTQQMLCQDYVDECPVENGFFADAVQCDRYYECKNGEVSPKEMLIKNVRGTLFGVQYYQQLYLLYFRSLIIIVQMVQSMKNPAMDLLSVHFHFPWIARVVLNCNPQNQLDIAQDKMVTLRMKIQQ